MKDGKKLLTMAILVIMVMSGVILGLQATAQEGPVYKNISADISSLLGSNPVTTEMNFSFARVAYTNQPTQMMWSSTAGYPSESFLTQTGEWLLNNSGYQIMNFNTTSSSVALSTFSVANYLGANVSYFYNDQRIALNGSATAYIYIGETALTGAPTASDVLASSAGSAQNNVYLTLTYSSTTGLYSMTLYYYAQVTGGNSQKYDNQTSVALTGNLQPLNFYDFSFNLVPATGMQVTIENYTGAVINQTTISGSDLTKNISKIAYVQYGLTGTGSSILDYGYIIGHNTYSYPASAPLLAGAMAPEQGIQANVGFNELDPGAVNTSATQSMNESSILNVNVSENSFSSVVQSSSNESQTSNLLNTSLEVNNTTSEASSSQAVTTLRATSGNPSISGTGTLYITSWTPSTIQSELMSFLQNYISVQTGYPAADITIVSYLITDIGFNENFSSQAMTAIQDYVDSMVPGMLQASNLALVNTTTGAIMAGAMAGDFYDFYMNAPAPPVITSEGILNPVTRITYSDLALAGFPAGSYISGASIVVPTLEAARLAGEGNSRATPFQRPCRRIQRLPLGTIAMVGIVVGGVLLSPITPWNLSSAIPENNPPGYWGRYSVPAGYAKVVEVATLVPSGASVLASTDLFPFVANDVNAYATLWYPGDPPYLPFNVTDPPRFVLVSQVMWANLPSWIGPLLSNPHTYGLRGYVPVTPLGWVRLFENQYQGNATTF